MTTPAEIHIRHTERDKSEFFLQARARSIPAFFAFIALTFGWSWGIGIFATSIGTKAPVLSAALMMVAGYGPSLAGLVVVVAFNRGKGLRDWLTRCLNWRVDWRWYALAFGLPPVVMVIALAIHGLLGGSMPPPMPSNHIPLAILNFGLVFLVGGPLGEELGWRGYVLPALHAHLNWRWASVVLGIVATAAYGRPYILVTSLWVLIALVMLLVSPQKSKVPIQSNQKESPLC
jgi:uncharacterized protein